MSTHTVASALIKLYYAVPGAPWIYSAWQDITGVRHGLFPAEDDKLPHGWTRQMTEDISSYFSQYSQKRTEDEKIKFAAARKKKGDDPVVGRALFCDWVTSRYSIWKVHSLVTQALNNAQLHPLQIMNSNNDISNFPCSTTYLPLALDQIAAVLFGPESLAASGHLLLPLREATLVLLQRTWENCRKQVTRSRNRLAPSEKNALEAFEGMHLGGTQSWLLNHSI